MGSHRLPTHRRGAHRIFFPLFIPKFSHTYLIWYAVQLRVNCFNEPSLDHRQSGPVRNPGEGVAAPPAAPRPVDRRRPERVHRSRLPGRVGAQRSPLHPAAEKERTRVPGYANRRR